MYIGIEYWWIRRGIYTASGSMWRNILEYINAGNTCVGRTTDSTSTTTDSWIFVRLCTSDTSLLSLAFKQRYVAELHAAVCKTLGDGGAPYEAPQHVSAKMVGVTAAATYSQVPLGASAPTVVNGRVRWRTREREGGREGAGEGGGDATRGKDRHGEKSGYPILQQLRL